MLTMVEDAGKRAFFGGVDKLRFKRPVVPGDQLHIEAVMLKRKGNIGKVNTVITIDGEVACMGELTFVLVDRSNGEEAT